MRQRSVSLGLGVLVMGLAASCQSPGGTSDGPRSVVMPASVGTVTAEQDFRWPTQTPKETAGALIDRLAQILSVDDEEGDTDGIIVRSESRSDRQLTVRLDLTDHLEGTAPGETAVFRYHWTAEPSSDAVVIHARSEYLGTADMNALPANEYAMYPNLASMAVMGMMMAPK